MSTNTGVGPAVADRVGGGDEGMADRDHLVARPDAQGEQGQVQRRRAAGDRAGVAGADVGGELLLERGHLGPLGDPAGEDRLAARRRLPPRRGSACDRDHRQAVVLMTTSTSVPGDHLAPPVRQPPQAFLERNLGDEAELVAGPADIGQPAGDRIDLPRGVELGVELICPGDLPGSPARAPAARSRVPLATL